MFWWFNTPMSRICEVCLKSYKKGNAVTRLIGNRVSNRSIKKQEPNLKVKRIIINGQKESLKLCTSCLKKLKKDSPVMVKGLIKLS
jgi:large subunit ribosomal protein L28